MLIFKLLNFEVICYKARKIVNTLPKFTQEKLHKLNSPVPIKETGLIVKNLPTKKTPGLNGFPVELYQTFKKEIMPAISLIVAPFNVIFFSDRFMLFPFLIISFTM